MKKVVNQNLNKNWTHTFICLIKECRYLVSDLKLFTLKQFLNIIALHSERYQDVNNLSKKPIQEKINKIFFGGVNCKSKILFYHILFSKKASIVLTILIKMIKQIGISKFSCILTDRGKEFYRWKTIEKHFKIRVYFCDPGKPRQKALVERINKDIKRWLGQNEPLINIRSRLKSILDILNTTIRPCLENFTLRQYFKKVFLN